MRLLKYDGLAQEVVASSSGVQAFTNNTKRKLLERLFTSNQCDLNGAFKG
jgi:hypothetical protein